MKNLFYLISFGFIAGMIFMTNCKKKEKVEPLTPQQEQAKDLSFTWNATSAQVPSGVNEEVVTGLSMTFGVDANFNPTTFITSGAPDFFQVTGTASWSFDGNQTNSITLTNVAPVSSFTINSLTETSLSITFVYTDPGARITSLEGTYTVNLARQ